MDRDLRNNGRLIFKTAVDPVKRDLSDLCGHLKTELEAKTARILDDMAADYSNVVNGQGVTEGSRVARDEVSLLLDGLDDLFEHALRASNAGSSPAPASLAAAGDIQHEPEYASA